MKKLLLILGLIASNISYAQSKLPLCNGNFTGPCFGERDYPGVELGSRTFGGHKYVGEWKDGKKNGQGTSTYADGEKYVGQFKDDKSNGQGTYTFASGDKYVGQVKDDAKSGQGTYTWADGAKYIGQWKDDKYDGFGTKYRADGSIIQQGLFSNNKFVQAQNSPTVTPPVVPKPRAGNEIVRCKPSIYNNYFERVNCDVVTDNLIIKSITFNGGRCDMFPQRFIYETTHNYGDRITFSRATTCGKVFDFQINTNQGTFSQNVYY